MAIDYAALKAELTSDPQNLGYAAMLNRMVPHPYKGPVEKRPSDWTEFVRGPDDQGLADLLNDVTKGGTAPKQTIEKGEVLMALAGPSVMVLPSKSAEVQSKWDRVLRILQAADQSIRLIEADGVTPTTARQLFDLAVMDGLFSPAQIAALATKNISRAEALFGQGTKVSANDVGVARNS